MSLQVAGHGPLLGVDEKIRDAVARADGALPGRLVRPAVDHAAHLLSDLGGSLIAVPVLAGCAALAAWRSRGTGTGGPRSAFVTATVAALLIPPLVVPAKAFFARPGPGGRPLLPDQWGWYPSGHTATAAIAYGTAVLLLARTVDRAARRRALYIGAGALCLSIGGGLVWCDFHWFLDVLGSWCLSGIVLWFLARCRPAHTG